MRDAEFMLHGMVMASHHSACKCATDVLFTPSSDLLAGIGQAVVGIGVTVMGTSMMEAWISVTVVGDWGDRCRDWADCGGDLV